MTETFITDASRSIDKQRQRLSALQDGELDPSATAQLLNELAGNARLRATWERYHLIGHAIRGEPCALAHRTIAERVRQALADEPSRLNRHRGGRWRERWRQVPGPGRFGFLAVARSPIGLAFAAGLVGLVAIATPALLREATYRPNGESPLASRASVEQRGGRWHLERPELAGKLDRLLLTHQETVPATGAKGMLHYANFVGYENAR